ncbi:hypothetical protein D3C71_1451660 [compost metagenome]
MLWGVIVHPSGPAVPFANCPKTLLPQDHTVPSVPSAKELPPQNPEVATISLIPLSFADEGSALITCGTDVTAIKVEQTAKLNSCSFLANKFILFFPSYDIIVIIIHLTLRRY